MEVAFGGEGEGCKIAAKKSCEGSFVLKDAVLIEYKDENGAVGRMRSPADGVVKYVKNLTRGAVLSKGEVIARIAECDHAIVIKDMCATCGKDLREKDGRAGERKEQSAANVSMIHHVPELIVSDSLAKQLGSQDEMNLLATRKLVLLVDLDQTIIHTTNRPISIDRDKNPDVTQYELVGGKYMTKLRPRTLEFLNKLSAFYEMHIVTFGQRQYAHRIAEILDPDHRIFQHRILSRDELFSAQHKTRNLKALFPCGEKLVVIIDDRSDVWQHSEALIQVKPYRYFKEVGDINAPKEARGTEDSLPSEIEDSAHEDNVLEEIERVLLNVHEKYYELHDAMSPGQPLNDVKMVINMQRKKVLDGVVIVFSGIVRIGDRMEGTEVYRLAVQFGAVVLDEVNEDVTHVVGARWGTSKVHMARKLGIPTVTVHWVYNCVEKWLKVDEREFALSEDSATSICRILGTKYVNDLANVSTLGKHAIADMTSEAGVDEALSEEDEEEEAETDERKGDDGGESAPDDVKESDESKEEEKLVGKRKNEADDVDESPEANKRRKHAPEEEYESSEESSDEEEEMPPMSYRKLVSKSKREGRMVEVGPPEDVEDFQPARELYDDEDGKPLAVPNGDDNDNEDDDDKDGEEDGDGELGEDEYENDEEMDSMAALIERQISGAEEES